LSLIFPGIPLYDKNYFLCGKFSFNGYDVKGNAVYYLENPDAEYVDDPPITKLYVEDKEGFDVFIGPYKIWILHKKEKNYFKYVQELQNFMRDEFSINNKWDIVIYLSFFILFLFKAASGFEAAFIIIRLFEMKSVVAKINALLDLSNLLDTFNCWAKIELVN
jgi:hypothetical protein